MESSGLDFKVETLKKNVLAMDTLILKQGAKVMALINDFKQNIVNGTLGEIVDLSGAKDGIIKMKKYKTGEIVDIVKYKWKMEEYNEVQGQDVEIASVTQFPLKLAWALTIHKSQGATFDYVNLDLRDTFVENMGYVALSRITSLDGLYLEGYNDIALHIDDTIIEKDKEFLRESMELLSC
jgi:ATP-dependent exoDNAse (exonuclease V) alpha subunit